MPRRFLGIDIGTSGSKAVIIDAGGRVAASASAAHENLFPRPGWSEERPDDWWKSACAAVRKALRVARISNESVAAIGLSGQMHGSVFLDAKDRILTNAILWNDQRTSRECADIEQRAGGRDALISMVQNVALTGYTAPKVLWLRRNRPRIFAKVRTVLLPKDYIRFRLTGTRGGDVSDASGTLLFDVARRRWSHDLMHRLDLDPSLFPPVVDSQSVVGHLTAAAAREFGLKAGTPVVAGAGDQAASAVGAGVVKRGIVSATIGTSGVVFVHSDVPIPNKAGLLQSFCHAVPDAWCAFGCMLSAGGSLQWARTVLFADRLSQARTDRDRDRLYAHMLREAADSEKAAAASRREMLLFLPYLTGERCPYPHPHARGAWIGLTARHSRGDMIRAVLEGITIGMSRQIDMLRAMAVPIRQVRLAGAAARSAWWRQLQADVYRCRCVRMSTDEGSAMGAAILAAVGVGEFKSVPAACAVASRPGASYSPRAQKSARYRRLAALSAGLYQQIEPTLKAQFELPA